MTVFMAWHHYIRGKYDDDRCLSKSQSNKIAQFTSLRAVNGADEAAAGGSRLELPLKLALRIIYCENNSIAILAHKAERFMITNRNNLTSKLL